MVMIATPSRRSAPLEGTELILATKPFAKDDPVKSWWAILSTLTLLIIALALPSTAHAGWFRKGKEKERKTYAEVEEKDARDERAAQDGQAAGDQGRLHLPHGAERAARAGLRATAEEAVIHLALGRFDILAVTDALQRAGR